MRREFLIPPGMTFWQALQGGLVPPVEDRDYLAFVGSLPCCITGKKSVEVHHVVGHGLKGHGATVSDYLTIPLLPELHRTSAIAIHVMGMRPWEDKYGSQIVHVARTLLEAAMRGVLHIR